MPEELHMSTTEQSTTTPFRRRIRRRLQGKLRSEELVIELPERLEGGPGLATVWRCQWSLSKTSPSRQPVYGEDALDALINCLVFLKTTLLEDGSNASWLEPGDEIGLGLISVVGGDTASRGGSR